MAYAQPSSHTEQPSPLSSTTPRENTTVSFGSNPPGISPQDRAIAPSGHQQPEGHLQRSPQTEPFPDLDDDLDFDLAQLSPTFSHEVDTGRTRGASLFLGPAADDEEGEGLSVTVVSQIWVPAEEEAKGGNGEDEGVMEATERGLEWARMMFGDGEREKKKKKKEREEDGEQHREG